MSKNKNPEGQMDFLSLLSELGAEPLFEPEVPKKEPKQIEAVTVEASFTECSECWCRDCRHNSRGSAVPREMCGKEMPCPACDDCIAEKCATVCRIGSAKEGCMTRALEEGIVVPEV